MSSRLSRFTLLAAPLSSAALVAMLAGWLATSSGCAGGETADDNDGQPSSNNSSSAGGAGGAGGSGGAPPVSCEEDVDCPPLGQVCMKAACSEEGICKAIPYNDFGTCDDGSVCTDNDTCLDGQCVGGTTKFCPSPDPCHIGSCDPDSGACSVVVGNDGAQCDDMDPCTGPGSCSAGTCNAGSQIDCKVFDGQCTQGVCDPVLGCQPQAANEGNGCDDGQFCNDGETCQDGMCLGGGPKDCAPPGGCFVATCDEASDTCLPVPGNDGQACDDFSPCTSNTTCTNGACINGAAANDGMVCDDKVACTIGELCNAGTCGGGAGPITWLAEDFSDNSAGWTLGPDWQIGPATQSSDSFVGNDPGDDHTSTSDDGVAGVILGGSPPLTQHGFYYLESPAFNTAAAPGSVILGFYRWLNSTEHPGMHHTIEVWNGNQWILIYTTGFNWVVDDPNMGNAGWNYQSYDLTNYKNAAMKVRFGYDIGPMAFSLAGSWNIDDLLVAAAPCP
jgi:hypothetical protein